MAEETTGAPPGPSPAQPVASNGNGGQAVPPAAGHGAKETAPRFGGLRGGRAREDGLVPGSPEALDADKKKDRLRKKLQRTQRSEPAPLPSVAGTPGATQATPGAVVSVPGVEAVPLDPWKPEDVKQLFEQLVPAAEELTSRQISERAFKAKLPPDVLQE